MDGTVSHCMSVIVCSPLNIYISRGITLESYYVTLVHVAASRCITLLHQTLGSHLYHNIWVRWYHILSRCMITASLSKSVHRYSCGRAFNSCHGGAVRCPTRGNNVAFSPWCQPPLTPAATPVHCCTRIHDDNVMISCSCFGYFRDTRCTTATRTSGSIGFGRSSSRRTGRLKPSPREMPSG